MKLESHRSRRQTASSSASLPEHVPDQLEPAMALLSNPRTTPLSAGWSAERCLFENQLAEQTAFSGSPPSVLGAEQETEGLFPAHVGVAPKGRPCKDSSPWDGFPRLEKDQRSPWQGGLVGPAVPGAELRPMSFAWQPTEQPHPASWCFSGERSLHLGGRCGYQ